MARSKTAKPSKKPAKTAAKKKSPAAKAAAPKAKKSAPKKTKTTAPKKKTASGGKASKPQKMNAKLAQQSPLGVLTPNHKERKLTPFLRQQKEKLLQLRDTMVDSMAGVAQDTLRARAEGSEASAFGMHQADAGSDAYDRDFALSLLSQEQDALYEIDQALKRIELGTYGTCEMSGKSIPHARLEAIPFARFTVECQAQLERQSKQSRVRQSVTSLFGLTDDDEVGESEEEEPATADTSKE